jgi:hypothetical protein
MTRKVWYFYTTTNHSNIKVYFATWHGTNPSRSKIHKQLDDDLGISHNGLTGFGFTDDPKDIDDYTSERFKTSK